MASISDKALPLEVKSIATENQKMEEENSSERWDETYRRAHDRNGAIQRMLLAEPDLQ
jgi:hypothetical protein